MERTDIEKIDVWGMFDNASRNDKVTFTGNGREAELLVAGLKALAAQVALRDITVETSGGGTYPPGARKQGGGMPLSGEIDKLLQEICQPKFVSATDASDSNVVAIEQSYIIGSIER